MRNSRWSNPPEIKRALIPDNAASGGPVLYYANGHRWIYANEGHTIFLGVSGAGKSRRGTIPMIRSFIGAAESFVAVDPKGEICRQTACYLDDTYDVHVIDFRHVFESERWNPLASCYELYESGEPVKKQIALEMVDDLAHSLYPLNNSSDPFWIESARSAFVACAMVLFEHAEASQVTMANLYHIIAKGEERCDFTTYLKRFVDFCPPDSVAAMLLQSYISTANDTRAGIRSVFMEGTSMFARSEGLISMMSADDLRVNHLGGEKPTAIYIILPDESPIYDSVAGVLCNQLLSHYMRLAQDKYNGKLPRRLNVCLEELGNIGKSISSLAHLMSAGRSRNVRCQLVLQSLAQLDTLYGTSEATTIRSNADVLVAFRTNHWDTLAELSRKCGEREIEQNGHYSREPLISPSELAAMKTGQALVMISGATQFITWLPDYAELFDCGDWRQPDPRTIPKPIFTSVFDIRELAKRFKEKADAEEAAKEQQEKEKKQAQEAPDPRVDDLLARIDAQIERIELETAAESRKARTSKGKPQYEIVLTGYDEGKKAAVVKALSSILETGLAETVGIINDSLPYSIMLSSIAKAKAAYQKLTAAGGTVLPLVRP